jgi:hypothetical protein
MAVGFSPDDELGIYGRFSTLSLFLKKINICTEDHRNPNDKKNEESLICFDKQS